jgi:hypothetical protein
MPAMPAGANIAPNQPIGMPPGSMMPVTASMNSSMSLPSSLANMLQASGPVPPVPAGEADSNDKQQTGEMILA